MPKIIFIIFSLLLMLQLQAQDMAEDSIFSSKALEEVMVTAQHSPTHYTQAMHRVTIIKEQIIKERGIYQLDQALELVPFIRVVNDGVLGSQIIMRGVGASNVAIMIDGVPVIGRLNGALDLSQISLKNVQRIEIIDGALSAIMGNNAAGGVINIITKKSQLEKIELAGHHQAESIKSLNNQLNMGFKFGKFTLSTSGRIFIYHQYPIDSLRLVQSVQYPNGNTVSETKYPWNPKNQYNIGGQIAYRHSDQQRIIFKYERNYEYVSDYSPVRRPIFRPYGEDVFFTTLRNDYTVVYENKIKDKYNIELTSAYNDFNRLVDNKVYYIETGLFDSLRQSRDTSHFYSYFTRGTIAFPLSSKVSLMAGGNYQKEFGSGDRIKAVNQELNTKVFTEELGVFTDIKYTPIQKITLNGTIRLTTHNIYNNQWSASFQTKYNPTKKLSIRAGYAQGYRSPSLKELYLEFIDVNHYILGNTNLTPERSQDAQLTFGYNPHRTLQLNLNLYKTWIKDRITLTEYETLKYSYENISSYSVHGFQPSIVWNFKNLESRTESSVGYWSSNIDYEGPAVYGTVLDLMQTLRYHFEKPDINISLNYRYVGAQPIFRQANDTISIDKIEAYNMLNLSLQKSFFIDKFSVVLGAKNLLDVRSANVSSGGGGTGGAHSTSYGASRISQGRNYFLSLSWRI